MMPAADALSCRICGSPTEPAGVKTTTRAYHLRRCENCGFAFVADPDVKNNPYDEAYYRGKGADPLVNYVFDAEHPDRSIRQLEWRGTLAVVSSVKPIVPRMRWLDFGCGTGGFVRWLSEHTQTTCIGYDVGHGAEIGRRLGIGVLDDERLDSAGPFDVVTAVEVLEHLVDPQLAIDRIAELLAPGGVFFYTTGNAARHRSLRNWSYVRPEIHVAFFEPRTMERALRNAGLEPVGARWNGGFSDIVAYKILKNLRVHGPSGLLARLPWPMVTRAVDRFAGVTAFPLGQKPA